MIKGYLRSPSCLLCCAPGERQPPEGLQEQRGHLPPQCEEAQGDKGALLPYCLGKLGSSLQAFT